jgi:hypothetical protein
VMVGVNLTKIHCKHIWICHNETPYYNCLSVYLTTTTTKNFKNKIEMTVTSSFLFIEISNLRK